MHCRCNSYSLINLFINGVSVNNYLNTEIFSKAVAWRIIASIIYLVTHVALPEKYKLIFEITSFGQSKNIVATNSTVKLDHYNLLQTKYFCASPPKWSSPVVSEINDPSTYKLLHQRRPLIHRTSHERRNNWHVLSHPSRRLHAVRSNSSKP